GVVGRELQRGVTIFAGRAGVAGVARRRHHGHAVPVGVLQGRADAGAGRAVADRHADHVGAVVHGVADAGGQRVLDAVLGFLLVGAVSRVVAVRDDPHGQDLGLGRDAHDAVLAVRAVAVAGDDRGHPGAVLAP